MDFTFVTLKYNQPAAARRCQVLLDKSIFDSKNVASQRLRGGASNAPGSPLSALVDTSLLQRIIKCKPCGEERL